MTPPSRRDEAQERALVIERLLEALARSEVGVCCEGTERVVFPAKHPEVGDMVLVVSAGEVTLYLGDRTHVHFEADELTGSPEDAANALADQVICFVQDVLDDKVEFVGRGTSGGCRPASASPPPWWSRLLLGGKTYRWSGPV